MKRKSRDKWQEIMEKGEEKEEKVKGRREANELLVFFALTALSAPVPLTARIYNQNIT